MDYQTRISIVRNYELPQDIQDFIKKHGAPDSRNRWYSEKGKLRIQK